MYLIQQCLLNHATQHLEHSRIDKFLPEIDNTLSDLH